MHGQRVGAAVIRFRGSGLGGAEQNLRTALLRAIAGAAGLAALLALLTGLLLARRITRPVERIITVTRAMGGGDRAARVGPVTAPGELRELATAFDQMADTLDRQEQLRRDLVADVAHELRTPVAILQAGHEALLDGVVEPTPDQLTSLRDEVLRLARMVDDLQTLAAADAATLQLSLRRCDLAEVTAAAAGSLAGRFEAAGLAVRQQLAPAWVMADPRWLHQVITNLLTNALKFTPAGGQVTIQSRHRGHVRRAPGHRHRRRDPRRRAAAHLRAFLAGAAGGPDLRERHRPRGGRRARPGPRRPADRGQRARPRHRDDAHPARGLIRGGPTRALTQAR